MWHRARVKRTYLASFILALSGVAGFVTPGDAGAQAGGTRTGAAPPFPAPPTSSPAGSLAHSCGVPAMPLEARVTPQATDLLPCQNAVSPPASTVLAARPDLPDTYP